MDETSGLIRSNFRIKDGIQVGTNNINKAAECRGTTGILPDGEGFSRGNKTTIAGVLEGSGAAGNEPSKIRDRNVAAKELKTALLPKIMSSIRPH